MLFMKDSTSTERVTKDMLREFIKEDMQTDVNNQDLDIFMRTNSSLQNREIITRQMLKNIFEVPFREARDSMIENAAN